ncbi:50S ribosomal protein L10 [Pseudomonas aeruginosa]
MFKGPTLIAFSNEHPGAAARIFREFARGQDKFEIKAAAFEGQFLAANQIDVLASLPTYDEAVSQLMSVIQGATSKLARTPGGHSRPERSCCRLSRPASAFNLICLIRWPQAVPQYRN